MYYIINQHSQIVAADPQLLSEVGIEDADHFYKKVALKEITFDLDDDTVTIHVDGTPKRYRATVAPLAGMLGDIRLIDLGEALPAQTDDSLPDTNEETVSLDLDSVDLFAEKEPQEEAEVSLTSETSEDEELFELILPSDADNAIADIETAQEQPAVEAPASEETPAVEIDETIRTEENDNGPIYIDIERISEKIGISTDDYNLFLNEYIDTALTFEEALQSQNETEKEEALNTLAHLSNVLHLPFVGEILDRIKQAAPQQQTGAIESFFATLGRLTTSHFDEEKKPSAMEAEAPEAHTESALQDATASAEKRAPIDLSNVKPIHFDFQLEEAANDLSLPVELIEEFVNDFIAQAHEETEKMLAAYENGDLETVQKIGHLLKGTSSNLRITPLSDTLYEIQFNEDIERVPELVKNYWGHFLSLENQIKLISNK